MPDNSPILELFAGLTPETRAFVGFDNNIEEYGFDDELVAHRSKRSFPDMILRSGVMVEVKDSKSSTVTSFNSTYPSGRKSVVDIEEKTGQKKLAYARRSKKPRQNPTSTRNVMSTTSSGRTGTTTRQSRLSTEATSVTRSHRR